MSSADVIDALHVNRLLTSGQTKSNEGQRGQTLHATNTDNDSAPFWKGKVHPVEGYIIVQQRGLLSAV